MLPVVPIWRKVFCSPVKLFINNGPIFDVPLTFNDEIHVTLSKSVVDPETFNDEVHETSFDNIVIPETFNDETHVILLLIMVRPDIYIMMYSLKYPHYLSAWLPSFHS